MRRYFRKFLFLTLCIHILFTFKLKANSLCSIHFASFSSEHDPTLHFIAYLSMLLEQSIISTSDLKKFAEALEQDVLLNPIDEEKRTSESTFLIHWDYMEEQVHSQDLNLKTLWVWADRMLKGEKSIVETIESLNQKTTSHFRRIDFLPLPKGSIFIESDKNIYTRKKWNIDYEIEVMSTPVTQWQWVELMGENPSFFKSGNGSILLNKDGKEVELQPDYPVESITWFEGLAFANKLSEKFGYPPVCDLRLIDLSKRNNSTRDLLLNYDRYENTKGFRLPTRFELEFLAKAADPSENEFFFGDNKEKLEEYAWFEENSGRKTHEVAQLKPLIIQNSFFYDVLGNVSELTWNTASRLDHSGATLGGNYLSSYHFCKPGIIKPIARNDRAPYLGLRLVRTLD